MTGNLSRHAAEKGMRTCPAMNTRDFIIAARLCVAAPRRPDGRVNVPKSRRSIFEINL